MEYELRALIKELSADVLAEDDRLQFDFDEDRSVVSSNDTRGSGSSIQEDEVLRDTEEDMQDGLMAIEIVERDKISFGVGSEGGWGGEEGRGEGEGEGEKNRIHDVGGL